MVRADPRWRRAAVAGAVIALLATTGGCGAERHVSTGIFHAKRGEHDPAIEAFRRAVASDPGSAIAHFNLGITLSAKSLDAARAERFDGVRLLVQDANTGFARALEIDTPEYRERIESARSANFREFFNLAVANAERERLLVASEVLSLAFEATEIPLETNRALVLGLQIDLVRAMRSDASYARQQAMRVLAELDQVLARGPVDAQLAQEITAVQRRARVAMDLD